jgi:hypothetical protein
VKDFQLLLKVRKINNQAKLFFFTATAVRIARLLKNILKKIILKTRFLLPKKKFIIIKTTPKSWKPKPKFAACQPIQLACLFSGTAQNVLLAINR